MTCSTLYGRATLSDLDSDLGFLDDLGLLPEIYLPGDDLDSLDDDTLSLMIHWREDGKELTFHAPFVDLSPGGLDSRVLDVTRYRFSQVMDLAEKVHPRHILFHPGFDKWRFAFREDLWIENSLQIWSVLIERAARSRIRIVLENVFDPRPDHLGELRERLGQKLDFCLDTGHLNLYSEASLKEWLCVFGDGLLELHLHDNDGRRDLHLPVGEGCFDFKTLCHEVQLKNLEPLVVLEHHSREETALSLENFRSLLEEGFSDDGTRC
jgi:sugar phosphate isomerase/epimerase